MQSSQTNEICGQHGRGVREMEHVPPADFEERTEIVSNSLFPMESVSSNL